MNKQYKFMQETIAQGCVVLVYYKGGKAKHVRSMDRVGMFDGVVYVDGMPCDGYTFARKP